MAKVLKGTKAKPAAEQTPANVPTTRQPPNGQNLILKGQQGLQLQTLSDMMKFAECVVQARLAPKGFESVAGVVIALQLGAELGLSPMASLQNIAVINGRPALYGDVMLAVCRSSPVFDENAFVEGFRGDGDDLTAFCRCRRVGGPVIERTFSVRDAKKAGLWGKEGPWQHYPQRMLQMRARSWALRDAYNDVLRGLRAVEEEQDVRVIEVESREQPPANGERRVSAAKQNLRRALELPAHAEPEAETEQAEAASDGQEPESEPAPAPCREPGDEPDEGDVTGAKIERLRQRAAAAQHAEAVEAIAAEVSADPEYDDCRQEALSLLREAWRSLREAEMTSDQQKSFL